MIPLGVLFSSAMPVVMIGLEGVDGMLFNGTRGVKGLRGVWVMIPWTLDAWRGCFFAVRPA